jgi:predicted nuclease of predicted toxin-antitoxin system
MKVKLDENLGGSAAHILQESGHTVATVVQQGMEGADDKDIIALCQKEKLCLVTLDLGFSDTLQFPPGLYSGIAVLRPRARATHEDLLVCEKTLARALNQEAIVGQL